MANTLNLFLDELSDAEKYKHLAEQADNNSKAMLTEMAQDELKHAKYILKMHPELQTIIDIIKTI